MSQKLTFKQTAFIEHYLGDCKGNATEAAKKAGYKGDRGQLQTIGNQNLSKLVIKTEIDKIRAELAAEAGFTRQKQLKDLEWFKNAAKGANNHTAGISAIREQNEMLGFHRENAPNTEKEAAKRAAMDAERVKLAEAVARLRLEAAAAPIKLRPGGFGGDIRVKGA